MIIFTFQNGNAIINDANANCANLEFFVIDQVTSNTIVNIANTTFSKI